jgi:hypothetical protein
VQQRLSTLTLDPEAFLESLDAGTQVRELYRDVIG